MFDRDELLRRVNLAALLDELSPAPATRMGRATRWRCIDPGHDDQHPSVTIFTDNRGIQRWRCWSGGHGGTAIDALHIARGLTVGEAIEQLGRRVGAEPENAIRRRPAPPPPRADPVPLHPCVVQYVAACERILWSRQGRPVLDYLVHERGLAPEVLKLNRVGADPGPDMLRRPAGLPRGGIAAVFPALDAAGDIANAQARYLHPPAGRSKYDNPANRLGTNPRLAWVRPAQGTRPEVLLVCEGIPDSLTAATAGLAAIAILGASYPDKTIAEQLLAGARDRRVVLALDNDSAGRYATARLARALTMSGGQFETLPLPAGQDLNDFCLANPNWSVHCPAGTLQPAPVPIVGREVEIAPARLQGSSLASTRLSRQR